MTFFRQQLDQAQCNSPDCDHSGHDGGLYLHGSCHPNAQLAAYYENGVLTLLCADCDAVVVQIAVASRTNS
jgi:hypothetical protein